MNSRLNIEIIKLKEEVELLNSRLDKILNPDTTLRKEIKPGNNKPLSFTDWMEEERKKHNLSGVKDVDLK